MAALAALPFYLVGYGLPTTLEGLALVALAAPLAGLAILSRSGRLDVAQSVVSLVLVLFAAAVLATREWGMAPAPQDVADLRLPDGPVRPDDVAALRFAMAPRGYRMEQVDEVLDRLAAELADRDARIAELEADAVPRAAAGRDAAEPAAPEVEMWIGPPERSSGSFRRP